MTKRKYRHRRSVDVRINWLQPHVDGFKHWLGRRNYSAATIVEVVRLLAGTTALVAAGLASTLLMPTPWRWFVGAGICTIGTLISARGLVRRLGPEHRISSVLARIPGWRWIVGA